MLSLTNIATKVLQKNVHLLADVGRCESSREYALLRPILARCNAAQLLLLEEHTPSLCDYDKELWQILVQRTFPSFPQAKVLDWRRVFQEQTHHRQEALEEASKRLRIRRETIQREKESRNISQIAMKDIPGRRSGSFSGTGQHAKPKGKMSLLDRMRRDIRATTPLRPKVKR